MLSCSQTLVGFCASCLSLSFDHNIAIELKLDGLAKKVVFRKLETIDVLANSAALTAE